MNYQMIKHIINEYKKNYAIMCRQENYKWIAIENFQNKWDIGATDFPSMLKDALSLSGNLMDSGNYYPRKMIYLLALEYPEEIRIMFKELFVLPLDNSTYDKIENFKTKANELVRKYKPGASSYQDVRAITAYLTFKYPDIFYFFKKRMLDDFLELVEPSYQTRNGVSSLEKYNQVCDELLAIVENDNELVDWQRKRTSTISMYKDEKLHILVQDIINSTRKEYAFNFESVKLNEVKIDISAYELKQTIPSVIPKAGKISDEQREKDNRRNALIGNAGESFVFNYEQDLVKSYHIDKEVKWISLVTDSSGYDILSYDEEGNEKHIEVKTTSTGLDTEFFITENEKNASIRNKDNYYLYRVYNFDSEFKKGDIWRYKGDVTKYCKNPTSYKVKLDIN